MQSVSKLILHFSGWRGIDQRAEFFFRCPECKTPVKPVNVCSIVCSNCGMQGTKEHFSSVERVAA